MLLTGADEAERLCAVAVYFLHESRASPEPMLEFLGPLPDDYLLAVCYALPERERAMVMGAWADQLHDQPEGIESATADLKALDNAPRFELMDLPPEERRELMRFRAGNLRRLMGLDYELSPEHEAIAEFGDKLAEAAPKALADALATVDA
jgi:hypothetical protein